jgi:DNA-binding IclR family transcriptional regulator
MSRFLNYTVGSAALRQAAETGRDSVPAQPQTAAQPEAAERYKGEAIARAARVLALFGPAEPARTLADLAAATKVPKATLAGILDTLVSRGLLACDGRERYRLGYGWLRLGDVRRNQLNIRESALPLMRQIRDAIDETVILSLRVGDRRVHLDYLESTQAIRRITQIGNEAPLHVGAAGSVLLAGMGDDGIEAYLARALPPEARGAARAIAAAVKRDGYAVVSGTVNAQTAAVAAPVKAHSGATVAVLTISCPRERFTRSLERRCIAAVVDGAGALSRTLGYAP